MEADPQYLERLEQLPWLQNCGQPLPPGISALRAASWAEAQESCASLKWENVGLDAKGEITELLSRKRCREYEDWNKIAAAGRKWAAEFLKPLVETVATREGFSDEVYVCMRWDVIGMIHAHAYERFRVPTFYSKTIFGIYAAGHFPCGFDGDWPSGQLVVY